MNRREQFLSAVLLLFSGASAFTSPALVSVARAGKQTTTIIDLPPVIRDIVDERMEFQINLGRAMDTLRSDMRTILYEKPGMCDVSAPTDAIVNE
jgi:hypothetical protein